MEEMAGEQAGIAKVVELVLMACCHSNLMCTGHPWMNVADEICIGDLVIFLGTWDFLFKTTVQVPMGHLRPVP